MLSKSTVVFSAPQGYGKSRLAEELRLEFGSRSVVDNWWPTQPLTEGAVHLTHARDRELASVARRVTVIQRGWGHVPPRPVPRPRLQLGMALPSLTAWLAGFVLALVIGCSHYLDDIPDHSAEWDQVVNLQGAIQASIEQGKFDRAAQAVCGPQSPWVETADGSVQCSTKHGRPTITVRVSP